MKWDRVRTGVRCAFGEMIPAPEWALFGRIRDDVPRLVLCEDHAQSAYGLVKPAGAVSPMPDLGHDGKLQQMGNDL